MAWYNDPNWLAQNGYGLFGNSSDPAAAAMQRRENEAKMVADADAAQRAQFPPEMFMPRSTALPVDMPRTPQLDIPDVGPPGGQHPFRGAGSPSPFPPQMNTPPQLPEAQSYQEAQYQAGKMAADGVPSPVPEWMMAPESRSPQQPQVGEGVPWATNAMDQFREDVGRQAPQQGPPPMQLRDYAPYGSPEFAGNGLGPDTQQQAPTPEPQMETPWQAPAVPPQQQENPWLPPAVPAQQQAPQQSGPVGMTGGSGGGYPQGLGPNFSPAPQPQGLDPSGFAANQQGEWVPRSAEMEGGAGWSPGGNAGFEQSPPPQQPQAPQQEPPVPMVPSNAPRGPVPQRLLDQYPQLADAPMIPANRQGFSPQDNAFMDNYERRQNRLNGENKGLKETLELAQRGWNPDDSRPERSAPFYPESDFQQRPAPGSAQGQPVQGNPQGQPGPAMTGGGFGIPASTMTGTGQSAPYDGPPPMQPGYENRQSFNTRNGRESVRMDRSGHVNFVDEPYQGRSEGRLAAKASEALGNMPQAEQDKINASPSNAPRPMKYTSDIEDADTKRAAHRQAQRDKGQRGIKSTRDRNQLVQRNASARKGERQGMSAQDAYFNANRETGQIRANEVLEMDSGASPEQRNAATQYLEDVQRGRDGKGEDSKPTPYQLAYMNLAGQGRTPEEIKKHLDAAGITRGGGAVGGGVGAAKPTTPGGIEISPQAPSAAVAKTPTANGLLGMDPTDIGAVSGTPEELYGELAKTNREEADKFKQYMELTEAPDSIGPQQLEQINAWRKKYSKPPIDYKGGPGARTGRQSQSVGGGPYG